MELKNKNTKNKQTNKQQPPGKDTYSRSQLRHLLGWEILAHINFLFSRKFSRV